MTGQQGPPLPHENAAPDDPRSGAHLENNIPSGPTKCRGAFVGPEERSVNVIPFPASRASISRNMLHPLLRTAYMSRPVATPHRQACRCGAVLVGPNGQDRRRAVCDLGMDSRGAAMNLAKIAHFDSFRAYRWLVSIADPHPKLYGFLRDNGVDLNHTINLLNGAIALREWDIGGKKEEAILLPVIDEDGATPVDIVVFSVADPPRFETILGLGAILGLGEVMNPASYWGGTPCRLLRTPLEWLQEGIAGCAVVLDPSRSWPTLDWAPGKLAAKDMAHAEELVAAGAVNPKQLVVPASPWSAAA